MAFLLSCSGVGALASDELSLAGDWRLALDRADVGVEERWFDGGLSERIELPGILQAQGFGDEISVDTPWVLSLHDQNWALREDYRPYTNADRRITRGHWGQHVGSPQRSALRRRACPSCRKGLRLALLGRPKYDQPTALTRMGMKTKARRVATIPRVVLLIESSRGSGRALLCGVASYVHHHGPWSIHWEPAGLEKAWPVLKDLNPDGIILRDVRDLDEVLALGIPAVVVGHSRGEVPNQVNVVTDSPRISRLAAEHLMGCGFKHFAYCGYGEAPMERTSWSELRRQYFSEVIHDAGFEAPACRSVSMVPSSWPDTLHELAQWLTSLSRPVGLMACNDDCSRMVMEACKMAGLTVPDMVGVVGVDNDEVVCGLTDPPLSSVAMNFERAGYEVAHALDGLMRQRREVQLKINVTASHVVARRSTDFVAAEEVHLAKALRFIRDYARGALSVDEVARASGCSRRALEKRFRTLLGRSVLDEIRRARTDQIAQLLVETDLPVAQIAELLSFPDVQHVARYFRAAKRMSPLGFRKAYGLKRGLQDGA